MTRNVAAGSIPAVLWRDLRQVSLDPDDPSGALTGDADLVVLHNLDGLPWLTAFPHISGANSSGVALVGNFFGFFAYGSQDRKFRHLPSDISPNFDTSVTGSTSNLRAEDATAEVSIPGLWVPLRELNATTPASVTFDNTVRVDKDDVTGGAKRQRSLTPREIYVGGATQIVFLPSTALDTIAADFCQLIGILHS